ncbi:nickel-transporting ATPase [Ketogulonicigenium robustum]|uniref:Nickel-transporting ATPase n=1 Tax=Ketogulonicigenium robustum TaxID=92947 RepID=A0A1W6NYQ1_9RHOB|nr:ABC transporter ATP-binding protein [Ketogulonicigenium robustum]ARO14372.1 nickel-transporting ATPase [Ketogulonicigenium robustum]
MNTRENTPLLDVRNLNISYRQGQTTKTVVRDVSFSIAAGETVALVGESGSGKSTTAQSIIGLLPPNGRIETGTITLNGTDIAGWSGKRMDTVRGKHISLIPQDPASSLNPVRTIGAQIGEVFRLHGEKDRQLIETQVVELLDKVGLTQPQMRLKQYPHELSGGMRQRVLIAMAVALRPQLIIADEPTSALDVTVQRRILDLIDALRAEYGTAMLLVTHDLNMAADRADRVIVLKGGEIQEDGPAARVLSAPTSAYTKQLLADAPSLAPATARAPIAAGTAKNIIEVHDLVVDFPLDGGKLYRAVDHVSFSVARGTTHALVGESGSGKTTTARHIMGLGRVTGGTIRVLGQDLATLTKAQRRLHTRKVQMIYQSPYNSIDPRQTMFKVIEEPLLNFDPISPDVRRKMVEDIADRVQLPRAILAATSANLSGGQRQRVAIARALILNPEVLVLDEAVSALDVTVQAQILALLETLQRALNLTYVFVSHDLSVVRQIADTVSVLHHGKQVDFGPVERVFTAPQGEHTRDLIQSIPGRTRALADPVA